MQDLGYELRRFSLPGTSVNRLQLRTVSRSLARPLLTLYSSRAAGCYVRTQKVEEIHGESGRASDSHSPPGHLERGLGAVRAAGSRLPLRSSLRSHYAGALPFEIVNEK